MTVTVIFFAGVPMVDTNRTPTVEPTIRGVVLLNLFDWVRQNHGEPGATQLLGAVPAASRERYAGPRPKLVPTSPVPASEMAAVAAGIIALWGLPAYQDATAHVAISDLNGYMKMFLKIGTPSFVLRRLPRVLSHYCSVSELSIDTLERTSATLTLSGAEDYGVAIFEGAVGWIRAALELSGAEGLTIETEPGAQHYRYFIRWR